VTVGIWILGFVSGDCFSVERRQIILEYGIGLVFQFTNYKIEFLVGPLELKPHPFLSTGYDDFYAQNQIKSNRTANASKLNPVKKQRYIKSIKRKTHE
jgi:hypothetical protein